MCMRVSLVREWEVEGSCESGAGVDISMSSEGVRSPALGAVSIGNRPDGQTEDEIPVMQIPRESYVVWCFQNT